jgi:hypothetical protein
MATGYGYEYTPDTLDAHVAISADALAHSDIKFVRLTWVDLTNTIRLRIIPIKQFLKILSSTRPAISVVAAAPGLVFNNTSPGFGSQGELIYVPDMSSLRTLAYAPGHAGVFGWFESKEHSSGPSGLCPRGLLKRVVECVYPFGIVIQHNLIPHLARPPHVLEFDIWLGSRPNLSCSRRPKTIPYRR